MHLMLTEGYYSFAAGISIHTSGIPKMFSREPVENLSKLLL
jgi:hypothetical protein